VVAVVGVCFALGPRPNRSVNHTAETDESAVQVIALTRDSEAFSRTDSTEDNTESQGQAVAGLAIRPANEEVAQPANKELPLAQPPPPAAKVPIIQKEEKSAIPEETVKQRVVLRIKHRDKACADDLAKQLLLTPVVRLDLDNTQEITGRVFAAARKTKDRFPHPAPQPLLERPDLAGLPIRMGVDCHLGKEAAENLNLLSQKLRDHLSNERKQNQPDTRINVSSLRAALEKDNKARKGEWEQPEAIPTLIQMLMPEDRAVRMLLVDLLAKSPARQATLALAQRALFDLSPEVREAAISELKERPAEDYRDQLIAGFRYPWPPAADHAAEALAALDDRSSIPQLIALLDLPDPVVPVIKKGKTENKIVVKEMVRVNHLGNCLMCHPPSFSSDDLVRGHVPVVGQSIDPVTGGYYRASTTQAFVRADITYLKQDFSVQQPVAKPGAWPANQRFDYMVRNRPATLSEVLTTAKRFKNYPQREAVLFALRELTGVDLGKESSKWQQLLLKADGRVSKK
jgi:hypothetical protein